MSIELTSEDYSYTLLKNWITQRCNGRHLLVSYKGLKSPTEQRLQKEQEVGFYMIPCGIFWIRYKNKRIMCESRRTKRNNGGYDDVLTLRCFSRTKHIFTDLLRDAYLESRRHNLNTVEVWISNMSCDWQMADRKTARPLSSLVFADNIGHAIVDDAKAFFKRQMWYVKTGIPFRRGYMIEGPPGNGKSSLIHALASELNTNISVVNMNHFTDDNKLLCAITNIPKQHIVLIEDIDTVFNQRVAASGVKITFAGLLNVIDGVCAQEGRILVMTTNHKEHLDPALIRPGRADVHVRIDNAVRSQIKQMFLKFYEDENEATATQFASYFEDHQVSMATIQGLLMESPDAQTALSNAELRSKANCPLAA